MKCLAIELNDIALTVARDGEIVARQPGYALREGSAIEIGEAALRRARSHPQAVTNRFWDTLDQETLPSEGDWRETPAALAYRQFEGLWRDHGGGAEAAVLVVPPTFTRKQLGLILGMCRKAGIPVRSLVDSAIAALGAVPPVRQIVVVDMTLHRVTATRVAVDERLRRAAVAEHDHLGLSDFRRRWAAAVGDVCVRTTRYDPMHSADAEQALHDALPGLLERLRTADSAGLELHIGGEPREVSIPKSALAQVAAALNGAIEGLINEVVDPASGEARVLLTHRFADCPGTAEALAAGHGGATLLPADAAVLAVSADAQRYLQPADAVGLLTERPLGDGEATLQPQAPAARAAAAAPGPSHILVDQRIYAVSSEPFVIGTATREGSWGYRAVGALKGVSRRHCSILRDGARTLVRDHSTYGTYVNGQRIDGEATVADGDVVRVGNPGVELRLVREVSADGQA